MGGNSIILYPSARVFSMWATAYKALSSPLFQQSTTMQAASAVLQVRHPPHAVGLAARCREARCQPPARAGQAAAPSAEVCLLACPPPLQVQAAARAACRPLGRRSLTVVSFGPFSGARAAAGGLGCCLQRRKPRETMRGRTGHPAQASNPRCTRCRSCLATSLWHRASARGRSWPGARGRRRQHGGRRRPPASAHSLPSAPCRRPAPPPTAPTPSAMSLPRPCRCVHGRRRAGHGRLSKCPLPHAHACPPPALACLASHAPAPCMPPPPPCPARLQLEEQISAVDASTRDFTQLQRAVKAMAQRGERPHAQQRRGPPQHARGAVQCAQALQAHAMPAHVHVALPLPAAGTEALTHGISNPGLREVRCWQGCSAAARASRWQLRGSTRLARVSSLASHRVSLPTYCSVHP